MAFTHNPPKLIPLWLTVSTLLVLWDAAYCLLRPRSMPGGDLHMFWTPYELYGRVDYVYGLKAFEDGNGFTSAQAFLNLIECALNILYMAQWGGGNAGSSTAVVGLVSVTMTLSKTVLYWANEYYSDFSNVGHNDFQSLLLLWVVPNGAWIIAPAYCMYHFWTDIVQGLERMPGSAGGTKKVQ